MVVLAVALVAAGALIGVWLWQSSSTATEVLVMRADVVRGRTITPADVGVARISLDPAVQSVPAAEAGSVVGTRATVDLTAGSLVTRAQLSQTVVPEQGQSVVGVPIAPGSMPTEPLHAGDTVRLVQTPGSGGDVVDNPKTTVATVLNVTPGDTQTVVDVLVPASEAADLAARAATGKVALVLDSRER